MLYLLFLIKKTDQLDLIVTYANLLLSYPTDYLNNDEWYSLHVFFGEYYVNKKNFDKSIHHFKLANTYLSKKWKEYISQITVLKNYLGLQDYEAVRVAYEDKMLEIILDNNLHNSHYLISLKNAYKELQTVYEHLKEISYVDSLTELYNRRYLWEKVDEFITLANKEKVPISCFLLDFDNFKQINDTYTHIEGDRILKKTCKVIKNFFRKTDIVIRFGGEEFLMLLFNVNAENALLLAEKLRKEIEELIVITDKGISLSITVSIGISSIKDVNSNDPNIIDKMIEEADNLMYVAKNNGKNRVEYKKD
jgi:diguanylate cyclase (GGDEF)-like protein